MNPRLFVLMVSGGALAGLPLGFFHQFWWLIVPPLAFGTYFFRSTMIVEDSLRAQGVNASMMPSMFLFNIRVIAWNCTLQALPFFVGFGASYLFT